LSHSFFDDKQMILDVYQFNKYFDRKIPKHKFVESHSYKCGQELNLKEHWITK